MRESSERIFHGLRLVIISVMLGVIASIFTFCYADIPTISDILRSGTAKSFLSLQDTYKILLAAIISVFGIAVTMYIFFSSYIQQLSNTNSTFKPFYRKLIRFYSKRLTLLIILSIICIMVWILVINLNGEVFIYSFFYKLHLCFLLWTMLLIIYLIVEYMVYCIGIISYKKKIIQIAIKDLKASEDNLVASFASIANERKNNRVSESDYQGACYSTVISSINEIEEVFNQQVRKHFQDTTTVLNEDLQLRHIFYKHFGFQVPHSEMYSINFHALIVIRNCLLVLEEVNSKNHGDYISSGKRQCDFKNIMKGIILFENFFYGHFLSHEIVSDIPFCNKHRKTIKINNLYTEGCRFDDIISRRICLKCFNADKSFITRVKTEHAEIERCTFKKSRFSNIELDRLIIERTTFIHSDLSGLRLKQPRVFYKITASTFINSNMPNMDLNLVSFDSCVFSGTVCSNTKFIDSSFLNVKIVESSFTRDCFQTSKENNKKVHMEHAGVRKSSFFNADFKCFNISKSTFEKNVLNQSTFSSCALTSLTCLKCKFRSTKFISCQISGSSFHISDLTDAVFKEKTRIELCRYTNASFKGAQISDTIIKDTDFTESRFAGADINNAVISHSYFRNVKIVETRISDSTFDYCDFSYARFIQNNTNDEKQSLNHRFFTRCSFTNCDFIKAVFVGTKFVECDFKNATFHECLYRGVEFINCVNVAPSQEIFRFQTKTNTL